MGRPTFGWRRAILAPVLCGWLVLLAGCGNGSPSGPDDEPGDPVVAITIDPKTATLEAGGTQTFTATVTGTGNTGVTWQASGGTITGAGATVTYTAPGQPGSFTVTATSVADPSRRATATVTVVEPQAALQIMVAGRLERGLTVELDVTRDGEPVPAAAVTWSATPANAVTFPEPGRALLREAGAVVLRAEVPGAAGTRAITVAEPPAIVFDMVVDGNRDIYRATLDGRDVVRLTSSSLEETAPSAAAGRVVFTTAAHDLYSVPVAGGNVSRLTNTPAEEFDPALSHDGARLAFIRSGGEGDRLWIASGNGENARRATNVNGFGFVVEAAPSWSPDGERIVYGSTHEGLMKLYILDTRTGEIALLRGDPSHPLLNPAWSPDGDWVAYVSYEAGSADIYRVHVQTGEVERVTRGDANEIQPDWLPDGRLVFAELSGNQSRLRWLDPAKPDEIHDIPLPGDNPRRPAPVR